jgi:hypothetical protein
LGKVRNGKGIKLMSGREVDETAKFGDVQRWSTDSEGDEEPITQTRLSFFEKEQRENGRDQGKY